MADPQKPAPNKDLYDQTRADVARPTPTAATPAPGNLYGSTVADKVPTSSPGGTASPYQIVTLIGEGGMGKVYLANDTGLGRPVALKRISGDCVANARLRERFMTEARAGGNLMHVHIVRVFALGEDQGGPFMAMEYIPGPLPPRRPDWPPGAPNPPLDLEDLVKLKGKLNLSSAVKMIRQLLSAVGYAHRNNIIHRDIKPANVLLNDQWEPKLADFGLARQLDLADVGKTTIGAQILTIGYGAPEQEIDASRADHRADLYAVGATLWYALTGESPRHFRESEVPPTLRPVLVRALQKDREKRFQSAVDFDQALERALAAPAAAAPATPVAPPAAGAAAVPGQCPKCGHVHHAAGLSALKFCEQCRAPLQETCINCTHPNGLWAKFCGSCGVDLAAMFQSVSLSRAAELNGARVLASKGDYPQAIQKLDQLAVLKHPRLTSVAEEAKTTGQKVRLDYAEAQKDRDEKLQLAQRYVSACDYDKAENLLARVPAPIYTEGFRRTFEQVKERQAEKARLRAEVSDLVRARNPRPAIPKVARVLELDPLDDSYRSLLNQLKEQAQQEREQAWRNACTEDTALAYQLFLGNYPESDHLTEAQELLVDRTRHDLLQNPLSMERRRRYLELRSRDQKREDQLRAFMAVVITFALTGAVGGMVVGGAFSYSQMYWPLGSLIAGGIAGFLLAMARAARTGGLGCLMFSAFLLVASCAISMLVMYNSRGQGNMPSLGHVLGGTIFGAFPGGLVCAVFGLLVAAPLEKARAFGPLPWHRYGWTLASLRRKYLGY